APAGRRRIRSWERRLGTVGRGLRYLVDDDADGADDGGDEELLALPPGDDAGAAGLVGAADSLRVDAGDDAVAEEPHHVLALLPRRRLADRQVLSEPCLLGGEVDPAVAGDGDRAHLR